MAQFGKVAVAAAVLFWSIGNLIVRGSDLTGPQIAFWRYLFAAVIYTFAHVSFVGPIRLDDAKRALPTAWALAAEIVAFFIALKETTIANATVIGALMPLLLFGVAKRRFSERIPLAVIAATLLAVAGVSAVVFGSSRAAVWSPRGDVLAVIALLLFAAYFAFGKAARESMTAFTLQTHVLLLGVPFMLVVTVVDSGRLYVPSGSEWLGPMGLIAFPTTGHFLITWAHAHVSLTLSSLMTLVVPVLSAVGAVIVFEEALTGVQIGGMFVVLLVLAWAIVQTNRIQSEGTPPAT